MTRFLSHPDQSALLADLANAGFVFDSPEPFQVIHHEGNDAIYLGQIDDNFCANVTACEGITFTTEIEAPETPYNRFA